MITVKDFRKYISYLVLVVGGLANFIGLIKSLLYHNNISTICITATALIATTVLFIVTVKCKKPDLFTKILVVTFSFVYFPLIFWQTNSPATFILNLFLVPASYAIIIDKKRHFVLPIINLIVFDIIATIKLSFSYVLVFSIVYLYILFVISIFSMLFTSYSNQLAIENKKISDLAIRDALTGLYNRTHLYSFYDDLIYIPVLADIDFFKNINDTYGHDEGDRVLKNLAKIFLKYAKDTFKVFRFGGEEFLIISSLSNETTEAIIIDMLNEIRSSLKTVDNKVITVSFGIGEKSKLNEKPIKDADENLYAAKNNGRNCICKNKEVIYR